MNYTGMLALLALLPAFVLPGRGAAWITETRGEIRSEGRVLNAGDILTQSQLENVQGENGVLCYRMVEKGWPGEECRRVFSFGRLRNLPPEAGDSSRETYKNLPVTGRLRVKDPEGEGMTYTLVRPPRRGAVQLHEDGTYTYTPRKNKVGIDSFTYTATDDAGNTSREAAVTLTIIQPTEDARYTDTLGESCCFAAQWMRSSGIFVGECLDGQSTFGPEKTVSQGEFIAMAVRALELPTDPDEDAAWCGDCPGWLKPYAAAALRSGLISGHAQAFEPNGTATRIQAGTMLCGALGLENLTGLDLELSMNGNPLTRADTAELLYAAHKYRQGGVIKVLP